MPVKWLIQAEIQLFQCKGPDGERIVIANDLRLKYFFGVLPEIIFIYSGDELIFIEVTIVVPIDKLVV